MRYLWCGRLQSRGLKYRFRGTRWRVPRVFVCMERCRPRAIVDDPTRASFSPCRIGRPHPMRRLGKSILILHAHETSQHSASRGTVVTSPKSCTKSAQTNRILPSRQRHRGTHASTVFLFVPRDGELRELSCAWSNVDGGHGGRPTSGVPFPVLARPPVSRLSC